MNGQTRARLAALAGTVALLLTGVSACAENDAKPGAEQAIEIADSLNITMQAASTDDLGKVFHEDARQANLRTKEIVAADLVKTYEHQPAVVVAKAEFANNERG